MDEALTQTNRFGIFLMKVRRYDYPGQFEGILADVLEKYRNILVDGSYILSDPVTRFETEFATFLHVRHVIGVNSGTDALILALMACEIGPGDEVITQANTFYATVAAIRLVGATPVLIDPDPATFLMTPAGVARAVTPRTRAIVPVHLYGKPTQLSDMSAMAAEAGITLIEDAAQAHGARCLDGKMAGSIGEFGCFSFHPSKNLAAAGDAGAISTNSDEMALRLRCLRALGQRSQNDHVVLGLNSKLDALQAIVLSAKLPALAGWNAGRRRIAAAYRSSLAGLPLRFQQEDEGEEHVYHLLQIGTPARDALLRHLTEIGVEATIRYPTPIHLQPAFVDLGLEAGCLPVAERLASELLALPIRPNMPMEEIDYVAAGVRAFFGSA
jgi:dTDP-4-amino-4,6-dideoxygalactose transaminase